MTVPTAEIAALAPADAPHSAPITTVTATVDDPRSRLRTQGVCGISDMLSARRIQDRREYLIEGLAGERQIVLLAGDSGLGKTPLLYQVTLCVAAGIDCLGMPTRQAATLYLDFEDTRDDAATDIVQPMLTALGLAEPPSLWSAWHYLDSPANASPAQIVVDWLALPEHEGLPKLIVVDPYEAWPGASTDNKEVRRVFMPFRHWQREHRLTVWFSHHVNKLPTRTEELFAIPRLEDGPRRWLERARGGKALINASDVRLGIETRGDEEGLCVAGFRRGKGKVGPIFLKRHFNEDGDATHYSRASLIERLAADPLRGDEITKFRALSNPFETGDVKRAFGFTHNERTNRLLNRWKESDKIIVKGDRRGVWRKVPGEST